MRHRLGILTAILALILAAAPAFATVAVDDSDATETTFAMASHGALLATEFYGLSDPDPHPMLGLCCVLTSVTGLFLEYSLEREYPYAMDFVSVVEIGLAGFIIARAFSAGACDYSLSPVLKMDGGERRTGLALNIRF